MEKKTKGKPGRKPLEGSPSSIRGDMTTKKKAKSLNFRDRIWQF